MTGCRCIQRSLQVIKNKRIGGVITVRHSWCLTVYLPSLPFGKRRFIVCSFAFAKLLEKIFFGN